VIISKPTKTSRKVPIGTTLPKGSSLPIQVGGYIPPPLKPSYSGGLPIRTDTIPLQFDDDKSIINSIDNDLLKSEMLVNELTMIELPGGQLIISDMFIVYICIENNKYWLRELKDRGF
jgi:hypothetical protein